MKRTVSALILVMAAGVLAMAQTRVLRTGVKQLDLIADGRQVKGGWHVMPEISPDIYETTASEVVFVSDKDTLVINDLKEWDSMDFVTITDGGDSAHVRVVRKAANPFENPDPALLRVASSGKLTKEQAVFDIEALIYAISQVHPDMFSVCRQEDLFRAVNRAKASLPDSVAPMQLYQAAAPVVAMIGDGHTNLGFPFNSVFTDDLKRLPLYADIRSDRSVICRTSLDSVIAYGDRILSINGVSADSILESMMPYVSGERPHFKLSRIHGLFPALFQMLYAADSYEVVYRPKGTRKQLTHTFPATTWAEIIKRCPPVKTEKQSEPYSYTADSINNIAVMDFRRFSDYGRMTQFADSMFSDLSGKNITNLIIDIRNNGGGNSVVGDLLLRYISPEPFVQMQKTLIRVTPLTTKLIGSDDISPTFALMEANQSDFIKPVTYEEGHFDGNVYLLTSNNTFSSAASFSWTFKECGAGVVIGEETGGMNVCYGDILRYMLPVSKLYLTISFKRFWQFRADENDIHGTMPDVAVPADDAMDAAMKLAKKNRRRAKR